MLQWGKCTGKSELGRTSDRLEDNIKICLQENNGLGYVTLIEERREEVCTAFWWGSVSERQHLEGLAVEWMIILKSYFQIDKWPVTFGFQKIWEDSCVTGKLLLASQEELCSKELVKNCGQPGGLC